MLNIGFMSDKEKEKAGRSDSDFYTSREIKSFEEQIAEALEELDDLPDQALECRMDGYECIIVREYYGDDYHVDEETRRKNNRYYTVFSKLMRCKRKYGKLDEWARCARLSMECLDMVAEDNGLYDPEKFKKMVFKGEVKIYGWFFPLYKGKDRKRLNYEYMDELIFSNEPPEALIETREAETQYMSDNQLRDYAEVLFTQDELTAIRTTTPQMQLELDYENGLIDADPNRPSTVVDVITEKEAKSLLKDIPVLRDILKSAATDVKSDRAMNSLVSDAHVADMAYLASFDKKHRTEGIGFPKFKGDISDKKATEAYLDELDEFIEFNTVSEYSGADRTPAEIEMIEIKEAMDKAGLLWRKMYGTEEIERRMEKARKSDAKKRKRLKARLARIQSRSTTNTIGNTPVTPKSSGKKAGKKKGKKKKSDSQEEA